MSHLQRPPKGRDGAVSTDGAVGVPEHCRQWELPDGSCTVWGQLQPESEHNKGHWDVSAVWLGYSSMGCIAVSQRISDCPKCSVRFVFLLSQVMLRAHRCFGSTSHGESSSITKTPLHSRVKPSSTALGVPCSAEMEYKHDQDCPTHTSHMGS